MMNIALNEAGGDFWTGGTTYINNLKKAIKASFPDINLYILTKNSDNYVNEDYDGIIPITTGSSRFSGMVNRIFRSRFNYDRDLKNSIKSFDKKIDVIFPSEYNRLNHLNQYYGFQISKYFKLPNFFSENEIFTYKKHIVKSMKKSPVIVLSSKDAQK